MWRRGASPSPCRLSGWTEHHLWCPWCLRCVYFYFVLFCMSAEWGQTHGPVPVLASRRIWCAQKHSLSFNSRCLVMFLLLRGRGECGCVERVVLCELKRQVLAPKYSECSFISVVSLCGFYPPRLFVLRKPFHSCWWWWCVPECDRCSCGHTGLVQFKQNTILG